MSSARWRSRRRRNRFFARRCSGCNSRRAFHRVLKLARTIADLAGAETIAAPHLAEALQYRSRGDAA
jgi:predicted ATPase with chaperone activity